MEVQYIWWVKNLFKGLIVCLKLWNSVRSDFGVKFYPLEFIRDFIGPPPPASKSPK